MMNQRCIAIASTYRHKHTHTHTCTPIIVFDVSRAPIDTLQPQGQMSSKRKEAKKAQAKDIHLDGRM